MAVLFDTATERIEIADNAKFDWTPITQSRTLVLYWKSTSIPNANGEYQVLFQLSAGSGNQAQFAIINNGGTNILLCMIANQEWAAVGIFYCVLPTVVSDAWYQIVLGASTNGNCVIRWNGSAQSVTHDSWDDNSAITPNGIRISNIYAISDNMTMAHVQWFSGLLTQAQTENLRNYPYCMDTDPSCLLSLHLDESSGVTAYDSQIGNTETSGTLTNSPTWASGPDIYLLPNSKATNRTHLRR